MSADTTRATVDWSAPIEAVNTATGEVRAVRLGGAQENPDVGGYFYTVPSVDLHVFCNAWSPKGTLWANSSSPWRIRNAQPQSQPETVPVEKAVWDRVVALVGNVAASRLTDTLYEAQQLHALLSPVDPDLIEAREIAADFWQRTRQESGALGFHRSRKLREGQFDDARDIQCALAAIKRGRALEQECRS
jgi:hypothetical protein